MSAECNLATVFAGHTDLDGRTIVLLNAEACQGRDPVEMLTAIAAVQPSVARAIIAMDDGAGDALLPNFAYYTYDQSPTGLRERWSPNGYTTSAIFQVSNAWAQLLAAKLAEEGSHTLEVEPLYIPIEPGFPFAGSVTRGHMAYYLYEHHAAEAVTVTVTPLFGNPNLYVNLAADLTSLRLPGTLTTGSNYAQRQQTSPGDDDLTIELSATRRAVAIGVFGQIASNFSLIVSAPSTEVRLDPGLPRRFELAMGRRQYFSIAVPQNAPLIAQITPISGAPPDLFLAAQPLSRPNASTATASALGGSASLWQHVVMQPADASRQSCATLELCVVHMSVVARSAAATFSIVGTTSASEAIHLVDGVPQAGNLGLGQMEARYLARVANGLSDLTVNLARSSGRAHVRVSANGHSWSSESTATGDERLYIPQSEITHCVLCDYEVRVFSTAAAAYTLVATSSAGLLLLSDGVPYSQYVNEGGYELFQFEVLLPSADLEIILYTFSDGDVDLYASLTSLWPTSNPAEHTWASDGHSSGGEVLQISHEDPTLAACTSTPGACVLYLSVYGSRGASSFTLTASAHDVADGFRVEEPASLVGSYPFLTAVFGPRLPVDGISACLRYADPHDACQPLANAADVAGSIALLDRGSTIPNNGVGSCQYPGLQFANKIVRVQQAGAIGAIVVQNQPNGGLINMVGTSHDMSGQVAIPAIFIRYDAGQQLKAQLANASVPCVRVGMRESANLPPMLSEGIPTVGTLSAPDTNGMSIKWYRLISPPDRDDLSITVDATFGNPDIFVSKDNRLPNQQHYTWSSRDVGSDTLVIRGHDAHACTMCQYIVGVLATSGDVSFTISYQVDETLRTLQPSTPLGGQEVGTQAYVYYRVFVDRITTAGIAVSVTPSTGAAEIYASFTVERPSSASSEHTWTSACDPSAASCEASTAGGSAIHVQPGSYCPRTPCLLYVSVLGVEAAAFSIVSTIAEGEARPFVLSDGEVQQVSLPAAATEARFTFFVDASVTSFVVDVMSIRGDPDLYMSYNTSVWPTRSDSMLSAGTTAGETLIVRPGIDGACSGCEYKLLVYAWEAHTEFFLALTTELGVRLLSDGVPAVDEASVGGPMQYFRYFVRTATPVDIILTPLAGNPSLYARFGCRPPPNGEAGGADDADHPCPETRALRTWASTRDDGVEQIVLRPGISEREFCTPPCTLYVGVRAESNCTFSLLVAQRSQGLVTLLNGMPQLGVVASAEIKYYAITLQMARGLTVSLTAYAGQPVLYFSNDTAVRPTPQTHTGSIYGPASPLSLPAFPGEVTYIFGVAGSSSGLTNYSLLAHSGGSMALLVDGVPLSATVGAGSEKLYRLRVGRDASAPSLFVTSLQGTVRLLLSIDGVAPTEASHAIGATATPTAPARLPLTPGATNIVAVKYYTGHADATASYSLLALVRHDQSALLLDGLPQSLQLSSDSSASSSSASTPDPFSLLGASPRLAHLRFLAYPGQVVSITAFVGEGEEGSEEVALGLFASTAAARPYASRASIDCYQRQSPPGAPIRLVLEPSQLSCGSQCHVFIDLASSADAKVTVIAATESAALQLQVGTEGCATVSTGGSLAEFAVLLDPDDAADDRLTLALHMCSGRAELWADAQVPPTLDQTFHPYVSTGELLPPVSIGAAALKGRTRLYAAVHGQAEPTGSLSSFCLEARPSGLPAKEVGLRGERGAIMLSQAGGLELRFAALSADEIGGGGASVQYEVWAALKPGVDGFVFSTWCGIGSSGQLLFNVSADALDGAGTLSGGGVNSGSASSDQAGGAPVMLRVPPLPARAPSCGTRVDGGEEYDGRCPGVEYGQQHSLTIIAVVRSSSSSSAAGGPPLRRFVYQPVDWMPLAIELGGGGGGVAFAIFVVLCLIVGCPLAAYKRRELLARLPPSTSARLGQGIGALEGALETGLEAAHGKFARIGGVFGTPRRRPRATRSVMTPSSEGMSAPLTLNSYQQPAALGVEPLPGLSPAVLTPADGGGAAGAGGAGGGGLGGGGGGAGGGAPATPATPEVPAAAATTTTRDVSDPAYNARLARARTARAGSTGRVGAQAPPRAAPPSEETELDSFGVAPSPLLAPLSVVAPAAAPAPAMAPNPPKPIIDEMED